MPTISYQGKHVYIIKDSSAKFATVPFFLTIDASTINLSKDGGNSDVIELFTHPDNSWSATDSCIWFDVVGSGAGDGTFLVSVDSQPSAGGPARSGRVTISSRAAATYLEVTQDPSLYLLINNTAINFSELQEVCFPYSEYIDVSSNALSWTASISGDQRNNVRIEGGGWGSSYDGSYNERILIEVNSGTAGAGAVISFQADDIAHPPSCNINLGACLGS